MSKTSKKEGEPMHGSKNRLRALVLAVCLLFSVAIGRVALAAGDGHIDQGASLSGENKLTVSLAKSDEAYLEDIKDADVVVDVYKVAAGEMPSDQVTYEYTLLDDYATLQGDLDKAQDRKNTDATKWEALAEKMADVAALTSGGTMALEGEGVPAATLDSLEPGLYLVLAHGNGITDDTVARSDTYEYSFDPILVAVPNKGVNADGIIVTDGDNGEWLSDVSVVLKSSQKRLYGSVLITKTVTESTDNKPATFVFHITEKAPATAESAAESGAAGRPYDEYVSVFYDGNECTTGFATHIPAGITVEISEVDAGPRYNADSTVHTELIKADDGTEANAGVKVSFNNTPNGNNIDGYGIENKFEHDGETWNWRRVPETSPKQHESQVQ